MQKRKREETKGYGCLFPREIFKFKSSEMAISASKTANSFVIITSALRTTSYNLAPTLDKNLNE